MIAYSRYAPHRPILEDLATASNEPLVLFASTTGEALAQTDHVRRLRQKGHPLVVWEWWPDDVMQAWGPLQPDDLVLSNGFFPHYSTVSWDRQGWVGTAAWCRKPLVPAGEPELDRLRQWTADYRSFLASTGNARRVYPCYSEPYLLAVMQNENDLVAEWWPEGHTSEWMVSHAAEAAARRGLKVLVKQHPYDTKEPEEYEAVREHRGTLVFLPKDAVPRGDMLKSNDVFLANAQEVWGMNSTMLVEAALLYGVPTRAFAPTLLDGHGVLAEENPFPGQESIVVEKTSREERRLALLRRVLSRQVSVGEVREPETAEAILVNREVMHWDQLWRPAPGPGSSS